MKRFKKGFTLSELLIVVAIIAVLVAIAIPVFTSQLEKSREATDLANARSAYAEVVAEAVAGNYNKSFQFNLKQTQFDWQSSDSITIGDVTHLKGDENTNQNWKGIPGAGGTCTITYSEANGVCFTWDGNSSAGGNTPALSSNRLINEKLESEGIMTTYQSRTTDGKWTGAKTAVSAVTIFNNNSTDTMFTPTLKELLGDTFTYQVTKGTMADGTAVRYIYITTDGTYNRSDANESGLQTVRYTYLYSSGHTSEKTTQLLATEYGTANWTKNSGFTDFTVD